MANDVRPGDQSLAVFVDRLVRRLAAIEEFGVRFRKGSVGVTAVIKLQSGCEDGGE
jgi:hypothetical protein